MRVGIDMSLVLCLAMFGSHSSKLINFYQIHLIFFTHQDFILKFLFHAGDGHNIVIFRNWRGSIFARASPVKRNLLSVFSQSMLPRTICGLIWIKIAHSDAHAYFRSFMCLQLFTYMSYFFMFNRMGKCIWFMCITFV